MEKFTLNLKVQTSAEGEQVEVAISSYHPSYGDRIQKKDESGMLLIKENKWYAKIRFPNKRINKADQLKLGITLCKESRRDEYFIINDSESVSLNTLVLKMMSWVKTHQPKKVAPLKQKKAQKTATSN